MATATRQSKPSGTEQQPDDLADLRAAIQAVARVTANVAAQGARNNWTDFRQLLRDQYGTSPADVETFMDVLAGLKP